MIRKTLFALTAACGLIAANELTIHKAEAQSGIKVGVHGKSGGISIGIGGGQYPAYYPGYPGYPGYYPPSVLYPTPPRIVAPSRVFDVYYRTSPYDVWRAYGSFLSHARAHDAMHMLRMSGYQTYEARR